VGKYLSQVSMDLLGRLVTGRSSLLYDQYHGRTDNKRLHIGRGIERELSPLLEWSGVAPSRTLYPSALRASNNPSLQDATLTAEHRLDVRIRARPTKTIPHRHRLSDFLHNRPNPIPGADPGILEVSGVGYFLGGQADLHYAAHDITTSFYYSTS
jgi:hypothetical protein